MPTKSNRRRTLMLSVGGSLMILVCLGWLTGRQVRQTRLDRRLMAEVERNHTLAAHELLWEGADPNSRYEEDSIDRFNQWLDGYPNGEPEDTTALVLASAEGHTDMVRLLVQQGADVNVRCRYQGPGVEGYDPDKYTALELAKYGHHTDTVRLLQQAGAQ